MKNIFLLFVLLSSSIIAQTNTEIYLFDIKVSKNQFELINGKNISNNKEYDSQPHFYNDNLVLFSSSRNGQTDIAKYNVRDSKLSYLNDTPNGGEYSPQKIPNSKNVSAVRLDNDGLQRLYEYDFKTGENEELIPDLKVAYPLWYNNNTIVASVIVNDSLHLIISNLAQKTNKTVAKMVGRSIHKIPNSKLVSFISKENKDYWLLKSLNVETFEIKTITSIGKTEDITWLINGNVLIPNGKTIYKFNPQTDSKPSIFHSFTDENINNISRMSVNAVSSKIAIVAEVSPEYLAEEQLKGYNSRNIEAFLKPFSKNVKVYNYPNDLRYEGLDKMRENYATFFENTPDLHCKILKRIVHKNQVIDHELVTVNGRTFRAVAIYTMKNGKIVSVTFI